jgi:hypothetical protein
MPRSKARPARAGNARPAAAGLGRARRNGWVTRKTADLFEIAVAARRRDGKFAVPFSP